jgi:hypothetical protein
MTAYRDSHSALKTEIVQSIQGVGLQFTLVACSGVRKTSEKASTPIPTGFRLRGFRGQISWRFLALLEIDAHSDTRTATVAGFRNIPL